VRDVLVAAERGALPPATPGHPYQPGFLFEAGIAPLLGLGLAGIVWYQGETAGHDPALHGALLETLVEDWRGLFGARDLPFLQVQLPGLEPGAEVSSELWPELREMQRSVAGQLAGVGLIVTVDLGAAAELYPPEKREVGERLAAWALAEVYGRRGIPGSGPLLRAHIRGEGRLLLYIEHAAGGLRAAPVEGRVDAGDGDGDDGDGPPRLRGFEVAGADGAFLPAAAEVVGPDLVRVWSEAVPDPRDARYGWAPRPAGNLENGAGLPAWPFSTWGSEP
jgi:sialate O-acetylesterase